MRWRMNDYFPVYCFFLAALLLFAPTSTGKPHSFFLMRSCRLLFYFILFYFPFRLLNCTLLIHAYRTVLYQDLKLNLISPHPVDVPSN
jgi:predicted membrane protein